MSFTKLWVHCVWSTKYRTPFLHPILKSKVIKHIHSNAKSKEIYIVACDGSADHLHCLIGLQRDRSLSSIMQSIKGESSYWINKNKLTPTRFSWQDVYYEVSVSPFMFSKIKRYIENQDIRHANQAFDSEMKMIRKNIY